MKMDIKRWWGYTRNGARYLICTPQMEIVKATEDYNKKEIEAREKGRVVITPLQYIRQFMRKGNFAQRGGPR